MGAILARRQARTGCRIRARFATPTAYQKVEFMLDFENRWDEQTGLYRIAPDRWGHSLDCFGRKDIHPLPDNAGFMIYAAQTGQLAEVETARILQNIRLCQFTDPARRGQIKWFLEDQDRPDANAPFFICLGLIPLQKLYADQLAPDSRALLDEILAEVLHYFRRKADGTAYYYPNSYMGDLLFAWILNEDYGTPDQEKQLLASLADAGAYWVDRHWGWGEHLSDSYSKVCCFELSLFLLLTRKLPADVRALYMKALHQLLAIDDLYGGKPRVPALRSYAFEATPQTHSFRSLIRDWTPGEKVPLNNLPPLGQLLHRLDWHQLAPPPAPTPATPPASIAVPCYNGTTAHAFIKKTFRIGAMSHFPVMEKTPYLPWQCFPVAFLHDDGDWGFLQWTSEEDGKTYAHPNHTKDYDIDRGLSAKVRPPITGTTCSLEHHGNLIVLRRMPSLSLSWTRFADRLRIVTPTAAWSEQQLDDRCSTACLTWPDGQMLSVARVTFSAVPKHKPAKIAASFLDWELEYNDFPGLNETVTLWAFAVDAKITEPPRIVFENRRFRPADPEDRPFELQWQAGNHLWRLRADPVHDLLATR